MTGLAFFVYKRPEYTQKVIEGINRNGFEKVYIFQDGLKNEEDRPLWEKVSELIRGIDFTETEIHISDFNRGLAESIIYGMNYVFERHNTAIALEDDILLADGFKTLMETMFDKYASNKKVMSICGGGYGVIIPETYPYDVYFSYRMSSVAFGTWKDRWAEFDRDPRMLAEIYKNSEKTEMLENAGNDIEKMIFASIKGKIDTWATYWSVYQINNLGYHMIPTKGYAMDIGRSGDGTNTTGSTIRYDIELDGEKKEQYNLPQDIYIDQTIVEDSRDLFKIADNKMNCYFDILCMWMRLYHKKASALEYFLDKNILKIYIYGIGNLTEFLCYDICPHIEIAGYILENRCCDEYNGKKVYDMEHYEDMEDIPIIIIPSYDSAFIRHFFSKCKIANQVIMIDDIIRYVLNKEKLFDDR